MVLVVVDPRLAHVISLPVYKSMQTSGNNLLIPTKRQSLVLMKDISVTNQVMNKYSFH
jgi:hypothetical protein